MAGTQFRRVYECYSWITSTDDWNIYWQRNVPNSAELLRNRKQNIKLEIGQLQQLVEKYCRFCFCYPNTAERCTV
jgi:hypothetical protein